MTTQPAPSQAGVSVPAPRRGLLPALGFANFTVWVAFFTPFVLTLPLKVQVIAPDSKAETLSVVLLIGSIFGLLTNPVAGRLSDRTTGSWGMRRPWLLGGVALGFVGLVVLGLSTTVLMLVIGSILIQIASATCITVILALLPEQVPPSRRGLFGAVLGVGQALATLAGVAIGGALGATPLLSFVVPGAVGVVGICLLCLLLRDRVLARADRLPLTFAELGQAFWRNPRQFPDFGWAWLSRFMLFMSFAAVINYQVFYLTDQLGIPVDSTATYVGAALGLQVIAVVLSSAVSGWLSDRVGRRKPFVLGAAGIVVIGLLCIALATALPLYLIGMAVSGIGLGTYLAVDVALIADILPDAEHDSARDFGVMTVAQQLPQTVSPAIAPLFLAIGAGAAAGSNYMALYLGSAVFAVIAAVAIIRVRGAR